MSNPGVRPLRTDCEIGVVIPTLNSASTLEWTILSLRKQHGCDVRAIVVDSGSTDGTLKLCKEWGIESIYTPPGNMYRAVNVGMRSLDCPWLTYLNSDDIVYNNSYSRLIELGENSGADVVYGYCDYIDGDGRFLYSFIPPSAALSGNLFRAGIMGFAQPASIFRREVFDALEGFNEGFRLISDFDFFRRALEANKKFVRLSAPSVSGFRVHSKQLSHESLEEVWKEKKRLLQDAGMAFDYVSRISSVIWRLQNTPSYVLRVLRRKT